MGGFPTWTLIGMGVSAGLAVLFTALAYLAQSPNILVRLRMAGSRFSQSGRRFTGLGLAATLVGMGFFMAGVPLGGESATSGPNTAVAEVQPESGIQESLEAETGAAEDSVDNSDGEDVAQTDESGSFSSQSTEAEETEEPDAESESNASGAFSQPAEATTAADGENNSETTAVATATLAPPTNTPNPTGTPTPTRTPAPTSTPTPTPTNTPTPTMTPTPITSETINVEFDGEITWVYRVPGNQRLERVVNGDQLLLGSGRAMVLGITWQEVQLLDGRPGWIQLSFLNLTGE